MNRMTLSMVGLAVLGLFVAISSATLSAQTFTEFPVFAGQLGGITAGPDGNMWFTELAANKIARITMTGVITEFSIPTPGAAPEYITTGADGNLWFTERAGKAIGRMTTDGVVTEFPLPVTHSGGQPVGIAAGPDGNLWYIEQISRIGRMTTAGDIAEFYVNYDHLFGIAAGPDGNVWFTVMAGFESKICRVTPEGVISQFGQGELSDPAGIVAGPDGNLWFTDATVGQIGRITPLGVITLFSSPSTSASIAVGRDGNLWFTGHSKIVRMSTDGVVTGDFPLPAARFPLVIALGPDGNLWFTEASGTIGRLSFGDQPTGPRRRAVRR